MTGHRSGGPVLPPRDHARSSLELLEPIFSVDLTATVIGGMAKTGTTLPLTLLDGHPDLVTFPEELRFFHMKADRRDAARAARKFLDNENTRRLASGKTDYSLTDYTAHGGTGFGSMDYSMFDWDLFERLIVDGFAAHSVPLSRFRIVIGAYLLAMGRAIPDGRLHFVCKAPHNERFARKWRRMLGPRGRFIQCTRDPMEHYLSLLNVARMYDHRPQSAGAFARTVRKRLRLWAIYPPDQLFVLDYDRLTADTEAVMRQLAEFIGVPFHASMLEPTKNGQPWLGNSSRGVVKDRVFRNSAIARDQLSAEDQRCIERRLHRFMARMGYALSAPVGPMEEARDALRWFGEFLRNRRAR